jgi:hypothetical protein
MDYYYYYYYYYLGVCMTYKRVLDWIIGFIALIHSTHNYI